MCLCWFKVFFRELYKLGKREQVKNVFTETMETNQALRLWERDNISRLGSRGYALLYILLSMPE